MQGKLTKITVHRLKGTGFTKPLCAIIEYEVEGVKLSKEIHDQIMLRVRSSSNNSVPNLFMMEKLPLMPLPTEITVKEGNAGLYFPTADLYNNMVLWLKDLWKIEEKEWQQKRKDNSRKACA
ncbi:MAG TPA: hypothetical protein VJH63_02930 [Candidatus Paceibacterota bacterium]